jgi:ribosomal protein S3AE
MAERKKFINVHVPALGQTIQVLGTPKELHNKTIKLDLSRKMRGKGVMITLQIFDKEGSLVCAPKKIEIVKSYIRRILRKRTDNVEDSFHARCSDIRVTLKPFLITRKKVSRAVRRNLRNTAREFLIEYVKDKTYLELCDEALDGAIQKAMLPKLKKVYPLAFCDLRVIETKDLAKIDLTTLVEIDTAAKKADTPEAEDVAEEEIEQEAITEAVEDAEDDDDEDEERSDEDNEVVEEKTTEEVKEEVTKEKQ